MDIESDLSDWRESSVQQFHEENSSGLNHCLRIFYRFIDRRKSRSQTSANDNLSEVPKFGKFFSCNLSKATSFGSSTFFSSQGSVGSTDYLQLRHSRWCKPVLYFSLLFLVVFLMLSTMAVLSPLFRNPVEDKESSETIKGDLSKDVGGPQAAMLNSEDQNDAVGDIQTNLKPKWINPCGISNQDLKHLSGSNGYHINPLSEFEILENVLLTAKNALSHSKNFNDYYVRNTFRSPNWRSHHETWKNLQYDWLPSWPDTIGRKFHRFHIDDQKVESMLKATFNSLQRLAVGLEQIVLDQSIYNGKFLDDFNEAEFKLKAVLCELQIAMLEKGIFFDEDVTRTVMSPEVRDIKDETYRNLRDWYIFRDYMKGLEYAVHTFKHLTNHPKYAKSKSLSRRKKSWRNYNINEN